MDFQVAFIATIDFVEGQDNCPNKDSYSPCICSSDGKSISCTQVPVSKVQTAFANAKPVNFSINLTLIPASSDIFIPNNIIGTDKYAGMITVSCPSPSYQLQIQPNSFFTSRNYTTKVTINYCDTSLLDLSFLFSFTKLTYLALGSNTNLQFSFKTLPYPLPSLTSMTFYDSRGLNETIDLPAVLAKGLTEIDMGRCSIQNAAASRILLWLSKSSNKTLTTLSLDINALLQVPSELTLFSAINYLRLIFK